jgi:hypothetical protein
MLWNSTLAQGKESAAIARAISVDRVALAGEDLLWKIHQQK